MPRLRAKPTNTATLIVFHRIGKLGRSGFWGSAAHAAGAHGVSSRNWLILVKCGCHFPHSARVATSSYVARASFLDEKVPTAYP